MHRFSPWPLLGGHGRVGSDHIQNPEAAHCFERPSLPQLAASSHSDTARQWRGVRFRVRHKYIWHGRLFAPNVSATLNDLSVRSSRKTTIH
jgi:hypothetical protein